MQQTHAPCNTCVEASPPPHFACPTTRCTNITPPPPPLTQPRGVPSTFSFFFVFTSSCAGGDVLQLRPGGRDPVLGVVDEPVRVFLQLRQPGRSCHASAAADGSVEGSGDGSCCLPACGDVSPRGFLLFCFYRGGGEAGRGMKGGGVCGIEYLVPGLLNARG